jgi:hypothetical protein
MLKICASIFCFGLMLLGFVLVLRDRSKAGQKPTDTDPSGHWLLIGLGLLGGILFAAI